MKTSSIVLLFAIVAVASCAQSLDKVKKCVASNEGRKDFQTVFSICMAGSDPTLLCGRVCEYIRLQSRDSKLFDQCFNGCLNKNKVSFVGYKCSFKCSSLAQQSNWTGYTGCYNACEKEIVIPTSA